LPELLTIPEIDKKSLLTVAAERYAQDPVELIGRCCTESVVIPMTDKSGAEHPNVTLPPSTFVGISGIKEREVLFLFKTPDVIDYQFGRYGESEEVKGILRAAKGVGLDLTSAMLTCCCPLAMDQKAFPWKAGFWKDFRPVTAMTINLVRPRLVVAVGADAAKSCMSLKESGEGSWAFDDLRGVPQQLAENCQMVAVLSPRQIIAGRATDQDLARDLEIVRNLLYPPAAAEVKPVYTISEISTIADLTKMVDSQIASGNLSYGFDCEWADGTYRTGNLRTIQLAWPGDQAAVIIMRRQHNRPELCTQSVQVAEQLRRLLKRPGIHLVGHSARQDLQWLASMGVDLHEEFVANGFDTMLAAHLVNENFALQLELQALTWLGMERYDRPLRDWLVANKVSEEDKDRMGYGMIPDEIIHPYAGMDAIASLNLEGPIRKEIEAQGLAELYTRLVHRVHSALNEMETVGMPMDLPRLRHEVGLAHTCKDESLDRLRQSVHWPTFNPGSTPQMRELLYGWRPWDEQDKVVSPPGARIYGLTPIKTTGDKKKQTLAWTQVMELEEAEQRRHAPSCDSESIAILSENCPDLELLLHYQRLGQLTKSFLRQEVEDKNGNLVWDGGVGQAIDDDGRLRTSFRQTVETGRYATSPNTQNWPKKQEADIQKAFSRLFFVAATSTVQGDMVYLDGAGHETPDETQAAPFLSVPDCGLHIRVSRAEGKGFIPVLRHMLHPGYYPLRSCVVADPGYCLMTGDWNQAELWTIGALSKCDLFLHDLAASDVHTQTTLTALKDYMHGGRRLGDMSVQEFNTLRKSDKVLDNLRGAVGKVLNFGVAYQISAGAIVRKVRRYGITVSRDTAQGWIDAFFGRYEPIYRFLEDCKRRVTNPGYLVNPYGRRRRFPRAEDRNTIAGFHREACNCLIQGTVGDSMSAALCNFTDYRRKFTDSPEYRIIMSIHDAVTLEVKVDRAEEVAAKVFPWCMVENVVVPGFGLQYSLGDIDLELRWGEHEHRAQLLDAGLTPACLDLVGVKK